ncbi:hypothetical protein M2277_006465 [Paenibacillus sp. LBL]|uniref:hypothetical protein n=1 Tax=Paenibacillus sp. LBL TaxID=2940563 RepID=UPI0024734B5E|nr:hypothetical protein [Paenibacillus sp. LBL]MDH6675744.1 hypothetical protein [Paenibacillus sp. LBL]
MNTILLIGAVDKSDLGLYLSKLFASDGNKVLLVDGSLEKNLKNYINFMDGEDLVSEFEGFEVSRKFSNYSQLLEFIEPSTDGNKYDVVLIDTDDPNFISFDQYRESSMRIIVSTYEKSCMEKNKILLESIYSTGENPGHVEVERVILGSVDCSVDEEYLNLPLSDLFIIWPEHSLHIQIDEVDYSLKIDNQHNNRLRMKRLSKSYINVLTNIFEKIMVCDHRIARKIVKQALKKG